MSYMAILGDQRIMDIASLVWNRVAQHKQNFIAWLTVKERLLTKGRLVRLNIHVDSLHCCLWTSTNVETAEHLFVECLWINTIKEALVQWLGVNMLYDTVQQVYESIRRNTGILLRRRL